MSDRATPLAQRDDIPALTGVRALAAAMVVFLHFSQIYGGAMERWLPPVANGALGVDIFFVLSGFIISHVYAGADAWRSASGYLRYLWRRFARIYPIHLVALLALIAMVAARGLLDTNFWRLDALPAHLLMLNAWSDELTWNLPAWSISAEWAAYMSFPLVAWAVHRPRSILPGCVGLAALGAVFYLVVVEGPGVGGSFLGWPALVRVLSEFFLGAFLYRLMSGRTAHPLFDWCAAALFMAAFVPGVPAMLQVLALGLFVMAVGLSAGWLAWLFSTRTAVVLGEISYAVYMIHFPVMKVAQNVNAALGWESPGTAYASLLVFGWGVLICALAWGAHHLIERPARARLNDFVRRPEPGPGGAAR